VSERGVVWFDLALGCIFVQAKTSLSMSESPESEFGKTADQMVRQWRILRRWKRPTRLGSSARRSRWIPHCRWSRLVKNYNGRSGDRAPVLSGAFDRAPAAGPEAGTGEAHQRAHVSVEQDSWL